MRWKQLSLLLLFSFACTAAHADTTYDVNLNLGGANASGTITTDGMTGVLATNDILGFNLTFTSGSVAENVLNKNAFINGSQFSATTDGLFYDFSNSVTANTAGFASDFTDTGNVLCFTGGGNCPGSLSQAGVIRLDGSVYASPESGLLEIASLPALPPPPVAATPEPSSLALLGTGLLGIVGVARRRFA